MDNSKSESRKEEEEEEEEEEDRISALPRVLQHDILSLLPTPASVRTSVLSRTWLHSWSTMPNLVLDHSLFCKTLIPNTIRGRNYHPNEEETREFKSYVNRTLTRYKQQQIDVQYLYLNVKMIDPEFASQVEDWIRAVIDMNTSPDLIFEIIDFSLPASQTILQLLFAARCLSMLCITGTKFFMDQPSLLSDVITINCHSLQILKLCNVVLQESQMEYVLSQCPRIKILKLKRCIGFKKLRMGNDLLRLENIEVELNEPDAMIEIETPNLVSFSYKGVFTKPSVVHIKPTQTLKYLNLRGSIMTDKDLSNLFSDFPSLEVLVIKSYQELETINISSRSLKKLVLVLLAGGVEAKIDAPSIRFFCYIGYIRSFTFSKYTNPTCRTFTIYPLYVLDNSFLLDLRDFALNQRFSTVAVCLHSEHNSHIDLEELSGGAGASRLEVEQIQLSLRLLVSRYRVFMEGLLWMFQPKYFTLYCYKDDSDCEIFLSGILGEYKGNHLDCCMSDQVKCWRHYLSEIEIEGVEKDLNDMGQNLWKFKLCRKSTSSSKRN